MRYSHAWPARRNVIVYILHSYKPSRGCVIVVVVLLLSHPTPVSISATVSSGPHQYIPTLNILKRMRRWRRMTDSSTHQYSQTRPCRDVPEARRGRLVQCVPKVWNYSYHLRGKSINIIIINM